MSDFRSWNQEDSWWQENFSSRPYAAGRQYEAFRPAYQYGYESANSHLGRTWNDAENDLRTGWDRFEGRGESTWENIKDAVKDAWHRVTGQGDVDTDRMAQFEQDRLSGGVASRGDKTR